MENKVECDKMFIRNPDTGEALYLVDETNEVIQMSDHVHLVDPVKQCCTVCNKTLQELSISTDRSFIKFLMNEHIKEN